MIKGFDRPLKPEWIYKTLKIMEPGNAPSEYYKCFDESIAVERIGKEGTRKIRTVLLRTFVYSFQEQKKITENNMLMQICKTRDPEFVKPLFLAKLLTDYEIFHFMTLKIQQLFDPAQEISSVIVSKKMVEEFGDREIVRRSARAFLATLSFFGILQPLSATRYQQNPKKPLHAEQVKYILKLYAAAQHSAQIDILNFDSAVFAYYQAPDLHQVALTYHNQEWEYIRGINRELLMMRV